MTSHAMAMDDSWSCQDSSIVLPAEVLQFLHAAAQHGISCSLWAPDQVNFVDARLIVTRECLELKPLLAAEHSRKLDVPLGFLRTISLVANSDTLYPLGVSATWADFLVVLSFFELSHDMELRKEFILLSSDVEAMLLCDGLTHLQRYGIPPRTVAGDELPAPAVARARAVFKALAHPDITGALQQWREGSGWLSGRTLRRECTTPPADDSMFIDTSTFSTASFTNFFQTTTTQIWEAFSLQVLSGTKVDPSLAAGWDVPQPYNPEGERVEALAAEGELSERWHRFIGNREPYHLPRSELRALFALGDRIPWQYRMSLWPHWLCYPDGDMDGHDIGLGDDLDEEHLRQIGKDIPRTRPSEFNEAKRAILGRVLLAYATRTPSVGYCQGMNFIVAVELLVGFTEYQALVGLSFLVDKFCKDYFEHSMSGLLRDVAVLDALLQLQLPLIHARFVEIDLPLVWIAAEPLLTLFSRELKPIDSVCRLWDFFLVEGVCAPFAVFLAYVELAHARNLLQSSEAEDALAAFRLLLGDAGAIANGLLRRASGFLTPKPFGGGLSEALLEKLRGEVLTRTSEPPVTNSV